MRQVNVCARRRLSGTPIDRQFAASDWHYMSHAINLAKQAEQQGEVPIGAVVVKDDTIIGEGFNQPIGNKDPSAHAEIIALRAAGQHINNYRLNNSTIYLTLEPCAMCAMAIVHARIERVVYAARDYKTGAAGTVFNILQSPRNNHYPQVEHGLFRNRSSSLLSNFFKKRRQEKRRTSKQ